MSTLFKPMLACDADLAKLKYPLLASAKLDGVRAVVRDGVVYSRSNKPIPNKAVQAKFGAYEHFDGELICGDPTSPSCYRDTVSVVMSHDKPADKVLFYTFDHVQRPSERYIHRMPTGEKFNLCAGMLAHEQVRIDDEVMLLCMEADMLVEGYEGLILRDPDAPYKFGRSTTNEGYLLKLKRFVDDEAVVIGFEERMENTNEKVTNALGRSQRSSHKAGKLGRNDLGALLLRTAQGVEFACGTGFNDGERAFIWNNQKSFLGKLAKYKHFEIGAKTAPRHPVFLGFRDQRDL